MQIKNRLLTHNFLPRSTANGPGVRSVLWVQGCNLACPGCINPATHIPLVQDTAKVLTPDQVIDMIPEDVQGLTISGGEPFQQSASALHELVQKVKQSGKSVAIFTGYDLMELFTAPENSEDARLCLEVFKLSDLVIAGRYRRDLPANSPMLASTNQNIYYPSGRYSAKDLRLVTKLEVIFDVESGKSIKTGIGYSKGVEK